MTLAQQVTAAKDPVLTDLAQQAVIGAAIAIANEGAGVPNHAKRAQLAASILNSPASWAPIFAQGVASQGLTSASTDVAINNAVAAIFNAYAGS